MVEFEEIPVDIPNKDDKTVMLPGIETEEWSIYLLEGVWFYENVNGEVMKGMHFADVLGRAVNCK